MFKTIDEALNWIMSSKKGEMTFKEFKRICKSLNNPQNGLNIIHVAGTNGKGSTIAFLRDLLMSQGFKVGSLQSPHYLTHLDRIRLNGKNISDEAFLRIINKNYDFFIHNHLGMFEMDYLIMLEYFKEEKTDFIIVETGIGGRLDSTNVVDDTKLSIITNIDYDHEEMLGDTLEKICFEKSEIIKDNSDVVVGYLSDNLKDIVKNKCNKTNSNYHEVKTYEYLKDRTFKYDDRIYELLSYATYQMDNASLALEALIILSKKYHFEIDYYEVKKAIANTYWAGRFELVHTSPNVILDGAHNPNGIKALCSSFDKLSGSKCIIFSALKRKDYQKMYTELEKHTDKLVVTLFNYNGSIEIDDINALYKEKDYKVAIKKAIKEYDNVLICGSLYFISEVAKEIDALVK